MTKQDLIKIIREVVKREVKSIINEEINQALTILENKQNKQTNMSLTEAINQTKRANEFAPYPEISASDLRARFAGMQGNSITPKMTDINNRPVDTSKLEPTLANALTRNYSELVKRF